MNKGPGAGPHIRTEGEALCEHISTGFTHT